MNDALGVSCCEGSRRLSGDFQRFSKWEPADTGQAISQALALKQLHDEIGHAVWEHAYIDDGYDLGMPNGVRRPRFVHEAFDDVSALRERPTEEFDRHLTARERMLSHINRAHSPFAEDATNLEVVDPLP